MISTLWSSSSQPIQRQGPPGVTVKKIFYEKIYITAIKESAKLIKLHSNKAITAEFGQK